MISDSSTILNSYEPQGTPSTSALPQFYRDKSTTIECLKPDPPTRASSLSTEPSKPLGKAPLPSDLALDPYWPSKPSPKLPPISWVPLADLQHCHVPKFRPHDRFLTKRHSQHPEYITYTYNIVKRNKQQLVLLIIHLGLNLPPFKPPTLPSKPIWLFRTNHRSNRNSGTQEIIPLGESEPYKDVRYFPSSEFNRRRWEIFQLTPDTRGLTFIDIHRATVVETSGTTVTRLQLSRLSSSFYSDQLQIRFAFYELFSDPSSPSIREQL